jgi:hypothetical protein
MIKGFSTGAIAKGDFRTALEILRGTDTNAVELSALRESEIVELIANLDALDLRQFEYVSVHAPSKLTVMTERQLIAILLSVAKRGLPVIVHPDIIQEIPLWASLGKFLCIENMDKRKKSGRSMFDLSQLFNKLPEASFCFDIAHAAQVDPSMTEAYLMLTRLSGRLKEIHISSVNSQSIHESITRDSLTAFSEVARLIPRNIPIIFESPVQFNHITSELHKLSYLFGEDIPDKINPLYIRRHNNGDFKR